VGFFQIFAGTLAAVFAVIPSYGIAIIVLTLIVRVLLLPLSIKQTRSMREMQRVQPEVKRIQAKHKGDRQASTEELQKLYKEHGINPFGGCAPLLMQFPALIGLFYVIRAPLGYMGYRLTTTGEWVPREVTGLVRAIQDSTLANRLTEAPLAVNRFLPGLRLDCSASTAIGGAESQSVPLACGDGLVSAIPYLLLVLLMGATTYYQQRQMMAASTATGPQAQQTQMLGRIMPVMLMFFSFSFPTGVVMYWLTTNVWMIAQQRIMLRAAPQRTPVVPSDGAATNGKPSLKSPSKAPTTQPSRAKGPVKQSGSNGGARTPTPASSKSPNASKKKRRR